MRGIAVTALSLRRLWTISGLYWTSLSRQAHGEAHSEAQPPADRQYVPWIKLLALAALLGYLAYFLRRAGVL